MSELTNIEENTEVSEQNTEVTPVETTEVLPKNKYEQIIKWMQEYTPLKNEWVFFNVSVAESGLRGGAHHRKGWLRASRLADSAGLP